MEISSYRYFITLQFDGTLYKGWQVQPNAPSVQETLEKALMTLLRYKCPLTGAGRTDTGVHAKKYTAHFDSFALMDKTDLKNLCYKLNRILPADIAIMNIEQVKPDAHARFSATSRSYHYIISRRKNPFVINKAWILERALDVAAMNAACHILKTYNDFQCFSKVNTQVSNFLCNVTEAEWKEEKDFLIFTIRSDRFLRNMVRAIVGTMVDIGLGKTTLDEFREILESRNRSRAGYSAPGSGLYFIGAEYPPSLMVNG